LAQAVHLTRAIAAVLAVTHQFLVFQLHHLVVVAVVATVEHLKMVLQVVQAAALVHLVVAQVQLAREILAVILQ
jgi:hypothetical protein